MSHDLCDEESPVRLREHIRQLQEQAAAEQVLAAEMAEELVRSKERNQGSRKRVAELEEQVRSLTVLLENDERELQDAHRHLEAAHREMASLRTRLAEAEAEAASRAIETDDAVHHARVKEHEALALMVEADGKEHQLEEMRTCFTLYKASHERFMAEGHVTEQLRHALHRLRREAESAATEMVRLKAQRLAEGQVIREELRAVGAGLLRLLDEVGQVALAAHTKLPEAKPPRGTVEEDEGEEHQGGGDEPGDEPTPDLPYLMSVPREEREELLHSLGKALSPISPTPTTEPAATLFTARLAAFLETCLGGAENTIDLVKLRREVERISQQVQNDGGLGLRHFLDLTGLMRRAADQVQREMAAITAIFGVQRRAIDTLRKDLKTARTSTAPLLDEVERLQSVIGEQQFHAGVASVEGRNEEVESLREMIDRLEEENQGMKDFMARLQVDESGRLLPSRTA